MTPAELHELQRIERYLDQRVEIQRVIINPDGTPTGEIIHRGWTTMPRDWQPPTLDDLIAAAKSGRRNEP